MLPIFWVRVLGSCAAHHQRQEKGTWTIRRSTLRPSEFSEQEPYLLRLDSLDSLRRWRDVVVHGLRERYGGCEDGRGLTSEEPSGRMDLEPGGVPTVPLRTWYFYLVAGLSRMRERGELCSDADLAALATGIIAAVEGGYVLAQTERSERPMKLAFKMALDHVGRFAKSM